MIKYKMPEACVCSDYTRYKNNLAVTTGLIGNNSQPTYTSNSFCIPLTAIGLDNFLPSVSEIPFRIYPGTTANGGTPTSGNGYIFPIAGPFSIGLTVYSGGVP